MANGDQFDTDAEVEAQPEPEARRFEDLSLGELIGQLLRHPGDTLAGLRETLRPERDSTYTPITLDEPAIAHGGQAAVASSRFVRLPHITIEVEQLRPLALLGGLFLIALVGSYILTSARGDTGDGSFVIGAPLLLLSAVGITVITAIDYHTTRIPPLRVSEEAAEPDRRDFFAVYGLRLVLGVMALLWGVGSWIFNVNNQFSVPGVFCWIMSVISLIAALIDRDLDLGYWVNTIVRKVRAIPTTTFSFKTSWTVIALIVILLVGAWYRFGNLSAYPVDMTSDHVEKLLDAVKVYEGQRPIFFPNNGGRESFQMYYLAVLKVLLAHPFDFDLLKLGTGIEGMIMILFAYWMGRAVLGEEDRPLGNLVGVCMAALVATSYWHTLLSRLGLRIVTTTLVVTVVFIFLARALRHNRRTDWIIAGFSLGAGMFFYQAVRMLPVVVIAGFILALFIRAKTRRAWREYFLNFVALVAISLMVFLPLGHYMLDNPADFWERTTGRLFGEDFVETNGVVTTVPFDQRWATFVKNLPGLADNMDKSLLMFNWKGDRSWFHGDPDGIPALDFFTGALFVVGLGVVLVRFWKRRDPVDLLLPISIVIMVLPSALAIAFTIEVPDFTRASGAFPMVYLVAAIGLAFLLQLALNYLPGKNIRRVTLAITIVLLIFGGIQNYNSYFVEAMGNYRESTLPHHQMGQILGGFINSTGAPGNAFMIAYPYWTDNRAIGIEAGDYHWNNALPTNDDYPQQLFDIMTRNTGTPYELQPDRQMMFFLNQADDKMTKNIMLTFPGGTLLNIKSYNVTRDFKIYVSPPLGCDWANAHLGTQLPSCANQIVAPQNPVGSPSDTPTDVATEAATQVP